MAESPEPFVADIAAYVADMCADLRRVATHPKMRTISSLLDMARVEAERLAEAERTMEERHGGQPCRRR